MAPKVSRSSVEFGSPSTKASADPAMVALQHFRLIFKSVKKHFNWVEQQTGVTGAQLWALAAIVEAPGLTVNQLARILAIHQSTASNLIDRLAKQGLVRRERCMKDQRSVNLHPETKGRRLLARAPKPLRGVLPDALSCMSVADLRKLNALLESIGGFMKVRDSTGKKTPLADI